MERYFDLMTSTLSTPFLYFNKIETKNQKVENSFYVGVEALNNGSLSDAINNFYASFKEDENLFESLNNTAALFNSFGRIQDSCRFFEIGIKKHPKNMQLRYNYGTVLFMNNAINEAKNQFEQAYSINQNNIPLINNYALTFFSLKNFDKAKELLEDTIKLDNKFELAYHNMAHIYMSMKDFKKAEENFKKVLEINSENVVSINDLGCCYCSQNKFEDGIAMFKKAFSLNNKFKNPYFNFGFILLNENLF